MSNRKSLRGAYLLVGAKGLSAGIGLLSTLVLARLLQPEDYGLVVLVDAVVTVLAAITELQLASVLIHLPKVNDDHFSTAWTMNLIRSAVLAGLVIALAPAMAAFYGQPELEAIAWGVSLALFMGGLINPKMAMLVRDLNFKSEFILSLSQKLVGFTVTVIAALILRNYWALVLGTIATQLCALVVSYCCVRFKPRFTLVNMRDMWGYSIWLTASLFFKTLNNKLDQFVVGKLYTPQTTGVFALGNRLATVMFTDTLAAALRVISPSLVPHQHEKVALSQAYLRSLGVVWCVFLPVATLASALSEPLISVALGEKWIAVTDVFRLLVLALCLEAIGGVGLSVVFATLNTRLAFVRDIASLCVRASCLATGIALGGFIGLLWGRALSAVADVLLYFVIAGRVSGLSVFTQVKLNWRSTVACFSTYGILWAIQAHQNLPWFEQSTTKNIAYLLGLALLGAMVQVAVQALLWWASGKPPSTEVTIAHYVWQALRRRFVRLSA